MGRSTFPFPLSLTRPPPSDGLRGRREGFEWEYGEESVARRCAGTSLSACDHAQRLLVSMRNDTDRRENL